MKWHKRGDEATLEDRPDDWIPDTTKCGRCIWNALRWLDSAYGSAQRAGDGSLAGRIRSEQLSIIFLLREHNDEEAFRASGMADLERLLPEGMLDG